MVPVDLERLAHQLLHPLVLSAHIQEDRPSGSHETLYTRSIIRRTEHAKMKQKSRILFASLMSAAKSSIVLFRKWPVALHYTTYYTLYHCMILIYQSTSFVHHSYLKVER